MSSGSRVSIITAYSSVAGLSCTSIFFSALGCGPCVKPTGGRSSSRLDVVAAEEVARVVEQHLVEIVVVVEERDLDRARVGLERAGA
jgi:hypothetical protein